MPTKAEKKHYNAKVSAFHSTYASTEHWGE
jgi:hypothetical protein